MGKIFVIIGKSATGKDTIYDLLTGKFDLAQNVMYTTRPIRTGEKDGVDYHFVTPEIYEQMSNENRIIESRTYNTIRGPWTYFTAADGFDLNEKNYLLENTIEGYNALKNYFGENYVIPLYIDVEDGLRLTRALERERRKAEPQYDELCRRFLSDKNDFSMDKLKEAGITEYFENDNLDECIMKIENRIKTYLNK